MPLKLTDLLVPHYIVPPFVYENPNWQYVYNQVDKDGFFYYYFLKDSLYYNALKNNDFKHYKEYMSYQPTKKHDVEGELAMYKKLIKEFDIKKVGRIPIQRCFNKYTLLDGTHRLSIMLHKGIIKDEIPDKFLITRQQQVEEELMKTVGNPMYNKWQTSGKFGYHSFNLQDIHIRGQRDCGVRLNEFRKHYDFVGKNVLDFGCNVGGMLFHLWEKKEGIGIDYDDNIIGAAKKISEILLLADKHTFIRHDFDKDNILDLMSNTQIINFNIDVIFLLSLQAWVKDWRYFYQICNLYKPTIFLEGEPDRKFFTPDKWECKLIMPNSYDDISHNYSRTTYIIKPK